MTFAAIKRMCKTEFGSRVPTLSELVSILPSILDARTEARMNTVNNKRLVIYHPRKEYREALESASWELNAAEMSNFHEAFEILDTKEKYMQLLD